MFLGILFPAIVKLKPTRAHMLWKPGLELFSCLFNVNNNRLSTTPILFKIEPETSSGNYCFPTSTYTSIIMVLTTCSFLGYNSTRSEALTKNY